MINIDKLGEEVFRTKQTVLNESTIIYHMGRQKTLKALFEIMVITKYGSCPDEFAKGIEDALRWILGEETKEIEDIKQRLRESGHFMDGSKHCGQC